MAKYLRTNTVLNKTRSNVTQSPFLKDVANSSQCYSKIDLQRILELLNTTNDVNLQIKLFSYLSARLMLTKDADLDAIIKCSAVYDQTKNLLMESQPRKATADALNFLSALLYVDAEEGSGTSKRKTLALYAKNMTRTSGCLGAMTDMFINCMFHDTWKALCQCLSIACSGCEINQSYCTHLVPLCIQKCSQTNIDVFLVLQSLLQNHNRNIQLFLECNGTAMFSRELLHYDKSLQLLTTVVQCPSASSIILRETKVLDDLRDFLCLYGPQSHIGQKAMIILNHIKSSSKGLNNHISQNMNKGNEKQPNKIECSYQISHSKAGNELDDTQTLMQNLMKEIYKMKQSDNQRLKQAASKVEVSSLIRGASSMNINSRSRQIRHENTLNKTKKAMDQHRLNRLHSNTENEQSFSFLRNQYKRGPKSNGNYHNNEKNKRFNDIRTGTNSENTKTQTMVNVENYLSYSYKTISEKTSEVDLKDFRPIFSSTPKPEGESSYETNYSKIAKRKQNRTTLSQIPQQRTTKVHKRRPKKIQRDKDLRNRSLSSRLFSAINDSCTTLVKSVANIFKRKVTPDSSEESKPSHFEDNQDDGSCSFSFLNYMKKRDAVLHNKSVKKRNNSFNFIDTKSCETCDDTEVLKQKLAKDEHLKQTIKKLKLGINLFGCDFKKISRTMWPRESYMTPVVLYNLYRKLLLKEIGPKIENVS